MPQGFTPTAIVTHCSASRFGDAAEIERWHMPKFGRMGYHFVVLNGRPHTPAVYLPRFDGKVEEGCPRDRMGAHCKAGGMNHRAWGVCLVGMPGWPEYVTKAQQEGLLHVWAVLCKARRVLPVHDLRRGISQHSDHEPGKPLCASLDRDAHKGLFGELLGELQSRLLHEVGQAGRWW